MISVERPTKATPVSMKESWFPKGGEMEEACGCEGVGGWVLSIGLVVVVEVWGGEGSGGESD